jgi:glycosyltransferase involved in cell wall biosynthesis
MYVQSRSGWFSDRSLCYLASGRPVLAQDTGLATLVPAGEGLILFTTLDEAIEGVEAIVGDYERHSRAARAVAEEHFASDRVLTRLLDRLAVDGPRAKV